MYIYFCFYYNSNNYDMFEGSSFFLLKIQYTVQYTVHFIYFYITIFENF